MTNTKSILLILSLLFSGCATGPYEYGRQEWKTTKTAPEFNADFLDCLKSDRQNGYFAACMNSRGHYFITNDWTIPQYKEWLQK